MKGFPVTEPRIVSGTVGHVSAMADRQPVPLVDAGTAAALRDGAAVVIATLAFLAGAGGLGESIFGDINFQSNVAVAGGLCILLAAALDLGVLGLQRALTPWARKAPA